jgi:hypothetical protein
VISEKARETKDLSLCDKLKNQQKMYCKQTLVTQLALANKNPDECTKIISASASGEQSLVASERSAVDNCRLSVTLNMATKREDGVWCGKIENVMMKTSCTQSIESRFPAPITPVSTGSTTPTRRSR